MSRESLSAVLRSSPCFLIQIFYGGQKGKLHGKLSVANEDLSHDTRKWSGRMNSEGESCHSGKLHLPFAGCSEPGLASCDSGGGSLPSRPKSTRPSPTVPGSQAHLSTRG